MRTPRPYERPAPSVDAKAVAICKSPAAFLVVGDPFDRNEFDPKTQGGNFDAAAHEAVTVARQRQDRHSQKQETGEKRAIPQCHDVQQCAEIVDRPGDIPASLGRNDGAKTRGRLL